MQKPLVTLENNLIQNNKNTIEMVQAKSVHFFMNIIAQREITFYIVLCFSLNVHIFKNCQLFYKTKLLSHRNKSLTYFYKRYYGYKNVILVNCKFLYSVLQCTKWKGGGGIILVNNDNALLPILHVSTWTQETIICQCFVNYNLHWR